MLRARVIRGRQRRKLEGIDGEHITERGFVPARELQEGDYLCYPIHRDERDVETVTMTYTKEFKIGRSNSTRTPERVAQAQALRIAKQSLPLLKTQHQLLLELVNRESWTIDEVREACSHFYRYDSGLIRALTQLCNKGCLLHVDRASYVVTDKGRKVAAEPYMSFHKLARTLNTSRSTAERLLNPPELRHIMQIEVPVNIELMRLVGYYLAEGSVANTTQNGKEGYYNVVELSFGLKEDKGEQCLAEDACRAAQALGFGVSIYMKHRCWHVVINSRHLAHWLMREFGSGAHYKTVPSWVIALPAEKLRPLIEAYIAGDGNVRGYQRRAATVSLQLAYAMAQVANRIGWRASVTKRPSALREQYTVTCYERTGRDVFSDGEYLYLPIRSITHDEYSGTVYNLTVADDESYCVGYHAVHNCRRYGASRRLNPNLDLSLLSRSSRMILAHPLVINTAWQQQRPPQSCKKEVPGHDTGISTGDDEVEDAMSDGLVPGIFAVLPITGFALIRYHDGSVNERARGKILAGLEAHGSHAIPVYETDR